MEATNDLAVWVGVMLLYYQHRLDGISFKTDLNAIL
jgi:hypothetical protein